eukprot:8417740-Heterocapsa_arctica.AAC.1
MSTACQKQALPNKSKWLNIYVKRMFDISKAMPPTRVQQVLDNLLSTYLGHMSTIYRHRAGTHPTMLKHPFNI